MAGESFGTSVKAQAEHHPTVRVRARATVRPVGDWAEVHIELKHQLNAEGWLPITHPDRPLLVARQEARAGQPADVGVRLAVLRTLGGQVAVAVVGQPEQRGNAVSSEWHYWLDLSHPVGVVLHTQQDGTVLVLGL